MTYLSVCSGIEAATVAWEPLGWRPWAFAEVDKFPSALLAHHYPDVPNLGDMTTFQEWPDADVDVLVGGTPCQSFSVAGLRAGLADPRGGLLLTYLVIARRYRPRWVVWENVPGVLSSDGGRAFGSLLGGLAELGYGFAYRILDAQHFGLAQRRARVFVVGHLGDWRRAAAVLFERASLSGHPAPRREAWQDVADRAGYGAAFGGNNTAGPIDLATAVNAHGGPCGRMDFESETFIAVFTGVEALAAEAVRQAAEGLGVLRQALSAVQEVGRPADGEGEPAHGGMQVRRLTVEECEFLQGFPRGYTAVPYRGKPAADGPRYKALGNSMAVPVMRWIGTRMALVDQED